MGRGMLYVLVVTAPLFDMSASKSMDIKMSTRAADKALSVGSISPGAILDHLL